MYQSHAAATSPAIAPYLMSGESPFHAASAAVNILLVSCGEAGFLLGVRRGLQHAPDLASLVSLFPLPVLLLDDLDHLLHRRIVTDRVPSILLHAGLDLCQSLFDR